MSEANRPLGLPRLSLLAVLLWLPLGLAVALATPWVELTSASLVPVWNRAPLVLTGLLLVWNLGAAFAIVGQTGRAHRAGPYTLALLALFTLLFFQIACHLGAGHYHWEQPPQWWDWLLFSGVHALRAGDLFDVLEAYGINLQVIHHQGALVASCLVLFHLILGLFLISVLFEYIQAFLGWLRAIRKTPDGRRPLTARGRLLLALVLAILASIGIHAGVGGFGGADFSGDVSTYALTITLLVFVFLPLLGTGAAPKNATNGNPASPSGGWGRPLIVAGGLYLLVLVVSAVWLRPWRPADLYLWPVDNLLHVLDVGDAMHLYHWHLSQVPHGLWEGSLTFLCRLAMGFALGGLVGWLVGLLSLRFLGGYGLRPEDLQELERTTADEHLRRIAQERLARLSRSRVPPAVRGWGWALLVLLGSVGLAALAISGGLPAWEEAAWRLSQTARAGDERAWLALQRMGPNAGAVADEIAQGLEALPPEQRRVRLQTLTYLGEPGQAILGEYLENGSLDLAKETVAVVEARGPVLASTLARGLASPYPLVTRDAERALLAQGRATMPFLIAGLTRQNARYHARLFEQIDPEYWFGHASNNPVYADLVAITNRRFHGPTDTVRDRRWSAPRLASLVRRLGHEVPEVREQARIDLARVEQVPTGDLLLLLDYHPKTEQDRDRVQSKAIHDYLFHLTANRLVDDPVGVFLALLRRRFGDEGPSGPHDGETLYRLFPDWQQAPVAWEYLRRGTRQPDPTVRKDAVANLARVGPLGAEQSVAVLIECLASDPDREVAAAAAWSLAQLGPVARPAIPVLRTQANSTYVGLRSAAEAALRAIERP